MRSPTSEAALVGRKAAPSRRVLSRRTEEEPPAADFSFAGKDEERETAQKEDSGDSRKEKALRHRLFLSMGTCAVVMLFAAAGTVNGMIGVLDAFWQVCQGALMGSVYAVGTAEKTVGETSAESNAAESNEGESNEDEGERKESSRSFLEVVVPDHVRASFDLVPPTSRTVSYAAVGAVSLPVLTETITPAGGLGNGTLLTAWAAVTGASIGGVIFLARVIWAQKPQRLSEVSLERLLELTSMPKGKEESPQSGRVSPEDERRPFQDKKDSAREEEETGKTKALWSVSPRPSLPSQTRE